MNADAYIALGIILIVVAVVLAVTAEILLGIFTRKQ